MYWHAIKILDYNLTVRLHGWRGGLVVGRRTCDLVVAGSMPGRDAAATAVTKAPGWAVATEGINSKVDVCEKAKHHTELFW